jgi:peroxiredoxin
MGEIVNLRRLKKAKARTEKSAEADANRTKHGVAKSAQKLAQARAEKEKQELSAHLLSDSDKK